MDRRTLIKNILAFSAGAIIVPSCVHQDNKASISLKNISVSGDQEKMLASFSETIIPKTSTPGAKELSSHLFMLMMVDDCMNKNDQQKFMNGMAQFEAFSTKKSGKGFADNTPEQRAALLTAIEAKKDVPEDVVAFYGMAKRYTVQSFVSSEYYLTKIQPYEMIPGRFHGCVPVKTTTTHG